jgi:hypothetical protein
MLVNLGMLLASTAITLLACEGAAALWARAHPVAGATPNRLLRSHPAPYARSPYYSPPFVEEQEFRGGSFFMPPGSDLILVRDTQGEFINNAGGLRLTTDAPPRARQRIFVFGGSTVYCGEVPDPFTIPSYLQRLVNAALPGQFAVVNAGVTSVNVAQQVSRLRTLPLAPDDIVVFYDGINDLLQGVYYQAPRGTIGETEQDEYARLTRLQKGVFKLTRLPFVHHSHLLEYVLVPFAYREPPPHVKDARTRSALFQQVAQVYGERLREGEGLARAQGARFVHFLQPNLFSAPLRTRYEEHLAANPRIVNGGFREVFTLGQEHLRRVGLALASEGLADVDLSGIFAAIPAREDIFLDAMHVTEVANRLVAQAIFGALFPTRLPPAAALRDADVDAFHREDDAVWARFRAGRSDSTRQASRVSLLANGDFAAGLDSWTMARDVDLAEERYPRVTLHNYLRQEIRPIADRMQIEVAARCTGGEVVRVNLHWADATGFGNLGADRFSFACRSDVRPWAFAVSRPEEARRAGLVIDTPDDQYPVVVYRVDVHPLVEPGAPD